MKRRVINGCISSEYLTCSHFRTRLISCPTTAIILTHNPDPFRDSLRSSQSVTHLLDYWIRVYNESPGNEKAYAQYLQLLQQHGVGKSEENSERFFRVSTELVIEAVLKSGTPPEGGGNGPPVLHYNVVDAYAKLVALLFKYMNSGGGPEKVAAQVRMDEERSDELTTQSQAAKSHAANSHALVLPNKTRLIRNHCNNSHP